MKKTIIFITHDLNESLRLGDRIAIMKDGEVVQVGTGEDILTDPANEYVERFVEDVDRAKVLTAENIMERPSYLTLGNAGPRVALQRMQTEGHSNMLVIDKDRQLVGYVTDADVANAVKEGNKDLKTIIRTDIPRVHPRTLVNELFDIIHDSATPVAVVEEGRLVGIVVRGLVIGALAKEREEALVNGE